MTSWEFPSNLIIKVQSYYFFISAASFRSTSVWLLHKANCDFPRCVQIRWPDTTRLVGLFSQENAIISTLHDNLWRFVWYENGKLHRSNEDQLLSLFLFAHNIFYCSHFCLSRFLFQSNNLVFCRYISQKLTLICHNGFLKIKI